MMIGLDLMVFCLGEEDYKKIEMGVDTFLDDFDLRLYIFYNIDYITSYPEYEGYTIIGCCGEDFICKEHYEVVKHKIEQIRILNFN